MSEERAERSAGGGVTAWQLAMGFVFAVQMVVVYRGGWAAVLAVPIGAVAAWMIYDDRERERLASPKVPEGMCLFTRKGKPPVAVPLGEEELVLLENLRRIAEGEG